MQIRGGSVRRGGPWRVVRGGRGVLVVTVAVILGVLGFASEPAFAGNTRFVWPASGTISQTAAEHWGSEHQYGVDIIGGGTVLAAADGRVVWGGDDGVTGSCQVDGRWYPDDGLGQVVTLVHDAGSTYYTSYGHLSQVYVTSGFVAKGQAIGVMGNTGCSTGVHVHFQIATCLRQLGNARVAGKDCSKWLGSDYARGTPVTAGAEIPADYPGMAGAQPPVVDPGWVPDGGWGSDVAIATIPGAGWEKFHLGRDGIIYRRLPWTNWTAITGPRAKRIAVTTSTDGRAELFYIGMNDQLYHHWETSPGGDISRWEGLGGYVKEIAAARSGNLWEVFAVGGDNAICRATQSNHAWQRMNGTWAYAVAAATSRDGRIELFHIAGGRNVMHAWQTSPGSGFAGPAGSGSWNDLSGWVTAIGASSVGNGEFELFAVGGSNTFWRIAPWSGAPSWQRIAGAGHRIAAARNPDGRVELVAIGTDGVPYHSWQKGIGWFALRA